MLTFAKSRGGNTCLPQQRKLLLFGRSTSSANLGRFLGGQQSALCKKLARSSVCRAAGVAEVSTPEESEIFKTNDGVVEAVDDDEAEVMCNATHL